MRRTGLYRIVWNPEHWSPQDYFWTNDKTWSDNPKEARIYSWEEKWTMKELPRGGIWEEIPWEE